MQGLGQDKRALVIDSRDNVNLQRASNNLAAVKFIAPLALNIHDLLKYETLVVSKDAVLQIQEVLKS
jgi:large subunit ribosomal protein L4